MLPLKFATAGEVFRPLNLALTRAVYSTAQLTRIAWYSAHYAAGRRKMGPLTHPGEPPYADEFANLDRERLKNSFRDLFKADWQNIKNGEYKLPSSFRRPPSIARLVRASRDYLRDTEAVARRKYKRQHSEVLSDDTKAKYPRYFLQNFHYQTDGWLTESSADRYDMQVETLFTGAADTMRRQALPPLRKAIAGRDPAAVRLLDVGCGTGGFLKTVKENWPTLDVTALDLSPAYLRKARAVLADQENTRFVEAQAEASELESGAYDIITSVYLFHELPPKVRRQVAAEIARLLKPGGTLIHVETIQYGDEPGLDILLENFPRGFHEPYFDSYCRTDLDVLFASASLKAETSMLAFLSKVSVYAKA